LIPATATPLPSAVPPTFTPSSDLSAPRDLTAPTPPPAASSGITNEIEDDPVAGELAALAQRRIADQQGIPVSRVEVVEIKAFIWTNTSLGCPLPDQVYTPVTVDGYRIVLEAADEQYIFHTDFDRVIPCDPSLEQLPDS
jgi:hypothetical protein